MPKKTNPDLEDALRLGGVEEDEAPEVQEPAYVVYKGSKIPVSKKLGKVWQGRIEQAKAARKPCETNWSEAIRYYSNDQSSHRKETGGDESGNRGNAQYLGSRGYSETENVVFANAVTMLPMLYAKNPKVEITAADPNMEAEATRAEKLINRLLEMKEAPGVNLKPPVRRGVLTCLLTNTAILKIDWIKKEFSTEETLRQLEDLSQQYAEAKDKEAILEIEGKIQALEMTLDVLTPAGPKRTLVSPFKLCIDPTASEADGSDANWMAEEDFLPTHFLREVFMKKVDGKFVSLYEPSHIIKAGCTEEDAHDEANFSLFQEAKEHTSYGYKSDEAFKSAQYTKVWYVWDKVTRRVLMFADKDFSWPLWVWDDPLKLLRFFPYHLLHFHESVEGTTPKGEVTYYLDQQDAINEINSEIRTARNWAKNKIIFNKNVISQADAENFLKAPDGTAMPADLPEGLKMSDVIFSFVPPALSHPELFNVESKFAAINRLTGINDAQRGAQLKTNTTNKAVDFYQKNTDIRVDERIDSIEDWIGDFGWSLLQLVYMNWTEKEVAEIIGQQAAAGFQPITDPITFRTTFNMRVVGGSTEKPTSKVKKKEALEIGQVLGQFGQQIPAAGIVALKVIARAFDNDVVITDKDWEMIFQSMQQQNQQGGESISPEDKAKVQEMIQNLPDEAKAKLKQLIDSGVPPKEALQQVQAEAQGNPQKQQLA